MENLDGIIVVNKTKGCTSHDIVYKVKKIFNKKVGHTGTLDPNATGVLPILIGKGTSLSQFLINHDKKYTAVIALGIRTETGDIEGKIIEEQNVESKIFDKKIIDGVLSGFIGIQTQKPPIFSAIKVNGKKLYEYARSGKEVEIPTRSIEIFDLNLLDFDNVEKTITIDVDCSKGTYIRTLCEDICKKLGTIGYLKELTRTQVGDFKLEQAITVEDLQNHIQDKDYIDKHIITIEKFFENTPKLILDSKDLNRLVNGVKLNASDNYNGVVRIYNSNNDFMGIAVCNEGKIKREIMK